MIDSGHRTFRRKKRTRTREYDFLFNLYPVAFCSAKNAKRSTSWLDNWLPVLDWWHPCSSISCTSIRASPYNPRRCNNTNNNSRQCHWRPRTDNRPPRRWRRTCRQSPVTRATRPVDRPTSTRRQCLGTTRLNRGLSRNSSARSVRIAFII